MLAGSALIVLAAEPLFILIDTAVVGHLGAVPLAALGAAGTVMSLLAIIGTALEYGTTGRAARYFGAGQRDAAVNEGVQASWLALLIGIVGVAIGQIIAGPLVQLIAGGAGPVADAAESWLRIAILGLPGILLILAGNGWLRGVQDTKSPVRIVVLASAIAAAASPLLVYTAGLGLEGSAVANVLAQWVGAVLCVRVLRREKSPVRPHWPVIRSQMVVGRDLVLRAASFQLAFLAAAGAAGRVGTAPLAAHQVGLLLWQFTAMVLDSFAIAAQSLVGAALGSGNIELAKRTAWRVSWYGVGAGALFGALMAAGWFLIPAIFTSDAAIQHQVHVLWPWLVAMMPVGGIIFALDGVLLGAGDNVFVRNITLLGALGAFLPVTLAAVHFGWGLTGIWAGLAAFLGVRFVGMTLRTRSGRWAVVGAQL